MAGFSADATARIGFVTKNKESISAIVQLVRLMVLLPVAQGLVTLTSRFPVLVLNGSIMMV